MSADSKARDKAAIDFHVTCMIIGGKAKTDPKAATWIALAYTLCASRDNHSITYQQAAFGSDLGTQDLWAAAKETAISYAQRAVQMLELETPPRQFADLVLAKAEALDDKLIPKTNSTSKVGGYPASVLPNPSDMALTHAKITREEFIEFVSQIPGHEWLTESDIEASSAASGKKCFLATAAFADPDAEDVIRLRYFRDEFLSRNLLGRAFIKTYEMISPPIAAVVARSSVARQLTRTLLVKPSGLFAELVLKGAKPRR